MGRAAGAPKEKLNKMVPRRRANAKIEGRRENMARRRRAKAKNKKQEETPAKTRKNREITLKITSKFPTIYVKSQY